MLIDVAYLHGFGEYYVPQETAAGGGFDQPIVVQPAVRNALKTQRVFASLIYRFSGRP